MPLHTTNTDSNVLSPAERNLVDRFYDEMMSSLMSKQTISKDLLKILNKEKKRIKECLKKNNVKLYQIEQLSEVEYLNAIQELARFFGKESNDKSDKLQQWIKEFNQRCDRALQPIDLYLNANQSIEKLFDQQKYIDPKILLTIDDITKLFDYSVLSPYVSLTKPYSIQIINGEPTVVVSVLDSLRAIIERGEGGEKSDKMVFVPLSDGAHWVYLLKVKGHWFLYDSLVSTKDMPLQREILKKSHELLCIIEKKEKVKIKFISTSKQTNGYECGSFIVRAYRELIEPGKKELTHAQLISELLYIHLAEILSRTRGAEAIKFLDNKLAPNQDRWRKELLTMFHFSLNHPDKPLLDLLQSNNNELLNTWFLAYQKSQGFEMPEQFYEVQEDDPVLKESIDKAIENGRTKLKFLPKTSVDSILEHTINNIETSTNQLEQQKNVTGEILSKVEGEIAKTVKGTVEQLKEKQPSLPQEEQYQVSKKINIIRYIINVICKAIRSFFSNLSLMFFSKKAPNINTDPLKQGLEQLGKLKEDFENPTNKIENVF